jgi:hypothetical protein
VIINYSIIAWCDVAEPDVDVLGVVSLFELLVVPVDV